MSNIILQVNNLNVEFPVFGGIFQREVSHVHAVNNVSIDIVGGKCVARCSPAACGLYKDCVKVGEMLVCNVFGGLFSPVREGIIGGI